MDTQRPLLNDQSTRSVNTVLPLAAMVFMSWRCSMTRFCMCTSSALIAARPWMGAIDGTMIW